MIDLDIPSANYEQADRLEQTRDKVVSSIVSTVAEQFPEVPYVGVRPSSYEQYSVWQDYASEYAAIGRTALTIELGSDSRMSHPSNDHVPIRLGNFTISLISNERDIRAEAYEAVLPSTVVEQTALSKLDKKRIQTYIHNDWVLLKPEYQYSVGALGQLTSNILFTHILHRLPTEIQILTEHMQQEAESRELSSIA